MYEIDTYAVMGNPIAHSKSPSIHQRFAKLTQQRLNYVAILVPLDGFNHSVRVFQQQGGKGLNITVPFKRQAAQLVDSLSSRARLSAAVNTIVFLQDGSMLGENTDGVGLVQDLLINKKQTIKNKRILILGAGGAACTILPALIAEKPQAITLANRTVSRAVKLANDFCDQFKIEVIAYADLSASYDLIINATSCGLQNQLVPVPSLVFHENTGCYDLSYGQAAEPFLQFAISHGVRATFDGWGMLVEQAAVAFYLWRGVQPDTTSFFTV